ncbi:hypothetical protein KQI63_09820 [bacterium]|nr:hypothetical protein [bacterium]
MRYGRDRGTRRVKPKVGTCRACEKGPVQLSVDGRCMRCLLSGNGGTRPLDEFDMLLDAEDQRDRSKKRDKVALASKRGGM